MISEYLGKSYRLKINKGQNNPFFQEEITLNTENMLWIEW